MRFTARRWPVDDRVELHDDPGVLAARGMLDLAIDELEESRAEAVRRDEEPAERALPRQAREDVEEVGQIGADRLIRGKQPEILVQSRSLGVVVARTDVCVAVDRSALLPNHERGLAVRLEPNDAIDNVTARALERSGPLDVGLLVEASFDLD